MPQIIQNNDPITYLIHRKYGRTSFEPLIGAIPKAVLEARKEKEIKVETYRNELVAKAPEEIAKLYAEEQEKERQETQQRLEQEEKQRFFNTSFAQAGYEHWGKATYWTLEEAIALSFGKDPKVVSWDKIRPYSNCYPPSPFFQAYERLRDLVFRAAAWKRLYDPALPGYYLAWAKRNDIAFPEELERQVVLRGGYVGDWKTNYDKLKDKYDKLEKRLEEYRTSMAERADGLSRKAQDITAQTKEQNKLLQDQVVNVTNALKELTIKTGELVHERDELIGEVIKLQQAASVHEKNPLKPKAKESLLKLVIGMAIDGYGYEPQATRTSTAREIAGHLAEQGILIDEDTVRKWLNEAKEVYSPLPETV
jgi:hypothetical protein